MPLELEQRWSDDAIDPDLKIFGTLMQGILWRPMDSGREIVLHWLEDIATNTVALCQSSNKQERRERFRQGLAEESLENDKHPSKVEPLHCTTSFTAHQAILVVHG